MRRKNQVAPSAARKEPRIRIRKVLDLEQLPDHEQRCMHRRLQCVRGGISKLFGSAQTLKGMTMGDNREFLEQIPDARREIADALDVLGPMLVSLNTLISD